MTSAAAAANMAALNATEKERKAHAHGDGHQQEKNSEYQGDDGNLYGALRRKQSWSEKKTKRKKKTCVACAQGKTDLPLDELAMSKYGKKYHELTKLESVIMIRQDYRRCRCLLNPGSPSMQGWGIVVLLALVFTSVMTPFEVAFIEPSVNALFFVNRFIDTIFVVDMVFNFTLMYKISTPSGTIWVKSHRRIACRYAKSWLIIDIISIIPFDVASLLNSQDPVLGKLKGLRVIRAFRMLKLARMMKAAKFLTQWQNNLALSFAKISLIKVAVGLFLISHWIACFWGMLGKLVGTSLECNSSSYEPEWHHKDDNSGVSWIYAHYYLDGHRDSPCNPFHLYASSLHFAIMTISSIGHGDITPQRMEEYYSCCLCMLVGAITWAYTIGVMSGAIWSLDPHTNYFEGIMDSLNYMMEDEEMPQSLRMRLRENLNEYRNHLKTETYDGLKMEMSQTLLGDVILQENYRWLEKIWYFKPCHRDFIVQVASCIHQSLYAAREMVPSDDMLCMLRRGIVAYPGSILTVGCYWGEDIILESDNLKYEYATMAVTFVEISYLKGRDLKIALQQHPSQLKFINKARIKLAFLRGFIAEADRLRLEKYMSGEEMPPEMRQKIMSSRLKSTILSKLIVDQGLVDADSEDGEGGKVVLTGGCWSSTESLEEGKSLARKGTHIHLTSTESFKSAKKSTGIRTAADASTKVSDPPLAPDAEIPKGKQNSKAFAYQESKAETPEAREIEKGAAPPLNDECPKDIHDKKEEVSEALSAASMDSMIQFPVLTKTLDFPQKVAVSKDPIQDALQFSALDMQRIADAVAFKLELHSSSGEGGFAAGRSMALTSMQARPVVQDRGRIPWRLRGGSNSRVSTM